MHIHHVVYAGVHYMLEFYWNGWRDQQTTSTAG